VSIDSFDPQEVRDAVKAGAELVLSVNAGNRDMAPDWGCEVVVLPDDSAHLAGPEEHVVARAANTRLVRLVRMERQPH
jgi:phage baseplate assembly protein W